MFTLLFIVGYALLVALITTIEFIHWVYTGVGTLAWAEHLLSILASRLFLQIAIPCIFIDIMVSMSEHIINALDKIRKAWYNKRVDNQRR